MGILAISFLLTLALSVSLVRRQSMTIESVRSRMRRWLAERVTFLSSHDSLGRVSDERIAGGDRNNEGELVRLWVWVLVDG